jgi:large subunit ribosomal protein L15
MSLGLHNLKVSKGAKKRKKNRVGRGDSSGHGTYSTRGLKGQRSRSGGKKSLKRFGMKAIRQSIPKYKGMKSLRLPKQIINLTVLQKYFNDGDVVDPKILFKNQLIDSNKLAVKVLGKGELKKKLTVQAHEFSVSAKDAIVKAGGEVVVLEFVRKGDKKSNVRKIDQVESRHFAKMKQGDKITNNQDTITKK